MLFAVSGYALYLPFARRHFGGGRAVDVRAFARNRALRLLPAYVVMVAVLLVLDGGGGWRAWLVYLTFSENVVAYPDQQINRVLWTLVVEAQFYLALPVLAAVIATMSRRRIGPAALVLTGLGAASAVCAVAALDVTGAAAPGWRLSLLTQFYFVAVGMLLALLRIGLERGTVRPPGVAGSAGTWLSAGLVVWAALVVGPFSIPDPPAMVALVLLCALVVGGVVLPLRPGRLVRMLGWRPLAAVGLAAYSLYLWHDPVLRVVARWDVPGGLAGYVVVAAPLIAAVTFLSYRLIEVPALRHRARWVRAAEPATTEDRTRHR